MIDKMKKYLYDIPILYFIVIGIILSSCSSENNVFTITPTIGMPSLVAQTPVPTQTRHSTNTPSLAPSPAPTLNAEEAIQFTESLLEDNNNCDFPCWWGITPGVTSWEDAQNFLNPFVLSIKKVYETETEQIYLISAPVTEKIDPILGTFSFDILLTYEDNEPIIQQINIAKGYQLKISTVLDSYGEPDQIWYWSNGWTIYDPEYYIILFYQKRGMMFIYFGEGRVVGDDGENYVEVCYRTFENREPRIQLWSPSDTKDFYFVVQEVPDNLPFTQLNIRLLEEISNTSVEEFTDSVRNENVNFCFQSNVEYWE